MPRAVRSAHQVAEFNIFPCFFSPRSGFLQKSLEFEDLGPKRIAALEKEAEEWRAKAEDAVASIQDITVTYFAQTSKALAGITFCVYVFHLCMDGLVNDFFCVTPSGKKKA